MARPKRVSLHVRNPRGGPGVIIRVPGKSKKSAKAAARRFANRHKVVHFKIVA
jgi:hypothetical protein